MNRFASILILLIITCNSRAQVHDSIKEFSITTDIAQYVLYQPNVGIGFQYNRSVFEINAGIIYPEPLFSVNPFVNGQYTAPGLVYKGESFRVNYKYLLHNHPKWYISEQTMYKNESFNNFEFTDAYNGDNGYSYTITNEKTKVFGLDMLVDLILGENSWYHLDFSAGLGMHDRLRNFDVTSVTMLNVGPGLGAYTGYIWYITPVIGIKAGFNFLKF